MSLGATRPLHRTLVCLAFAVLSGTLTSCAAVDAPRARIADTVVLESQRIGQRLPRLTLATFSRDSATVGGAEPQPVTLLNLWATYCAPCIAEMPALEAIQRHYAERGLRVLAVSTDQGDAVVKAFLLRNPLSLPIGRDPTGAVTAALANTVLPQNVLLAADGRVLYRTFGLGPDARALTSAIDAALATR
jgi:thiol-disulfide isomerase/thioredoxin